jgi:hypothetical protein
MILQDSDTQSTAKTWRQHAAQVADWQNRHMVNRGDQATYLTPDGWRASPGDVATRLRTNCHQLQPTVVYSHDAKGLCKWVCLDFDNHDESPQVAEHNLQMAVAIVNTAIELGIICLLEDSDGQGGLHLWVLFANPVPIDKAYRFARWLRSDYPTADIECNPKQRTVEGWGNGVRLPGHHHKRNHISGFYGDGEWIGGAEAIQFMLGTPTTDPSVLDFMADYDPDPPAPPKRALPRRPVSGGGGIVSQAERHIDSIPWEDLLQHFGWHGSGGKFWTRPGKSHGTSATLDHGGNGLFHVFSSAAGLPENQSYGKWRFWLHNMNFNDSQQRDAATRYLREVAQ